MNEPLNRSLVVIDSPLNLGLAPPGPEVNREFEACLMQFLADPLRWPFALSHARCPLFAHYERVMP